MSMDWELIITAGRWVADRMPGRGYDAAAEFENQRLGQRAFNDLEDGVYGADGIAVASELRALNISTTLFYRVKTLPELYAFVVALSTDTPSTDTESD